MKGSYAQYQGGGSSLPAGFMETATQPGRALAAGMTEAFKGIAEGIEKYEENKQKGAFLDQRFENLKPYMEQMLSDEDSGFAATHGKKIGLDLDKFSKSGLSSKTAMLADFEFLIQRYDKDRAFNLQEKQATETKEYNNLRLRLSQDAADRSSRQLEHTLGAPARAAGIKQQEQEQEQAGAANLSRAIAGVSEMMQVPGADRTSAINVARGSLRSPDNIKQFDTTVAAILKAEADAERDKKSWNLSPTSPPTQAIPGHEWPKLVNTSSGQKILVADPKKGGAQAEITHADVQKDLATIIGPEPGYKKWLTNNPQHATEATKIRRAFNLSTEDPAKPAQSLITGRLKLKAELRQLQAVVTATPNTALDALIKAKQSEIADYDTAINQAGTAPSTSTPAAPSGPTVQYWNPTTQTYQSKRP